MALPSGPAPSMPLFTPGVVSLGELVGARSWVAKTGAFTPTATLAVWVTSGSGAVIGVGVVISKGVLLTEGVVISESGQPNPLSPDDSSLLGEP